MTPVLKGESMCFPPLILSRRERNLPLHPLLALPFSLVPPLTNPDGIKAALNILRVQVNSLLTSHTHTLSLSPTPGGPAESG